MELVDTHCHIQSIGLTKGERTTRELWAKSPGLTVDTIIGEALDSGVTKMICVGCDLADSRLAIDLARDHPECRASIGIHPHEAQHYAGKQEKLSKFSQLIMEPEVVAVGECGFDFYYNHSPKAAQAEVLRFQIELALRHDKPLIFHVREAFDDFWPLFDEYKGVRGVLHSFTDSAKHLKAAMDRGLHIGINGIATFAKDPAQLEVYRMVPLEKLLLETDAPFLTPVPHRGSINSPKRLSVVADFLAGLRGEDRSELVSSTTRNAQQLFGI